VTEQSDWTLQDFFPRLDAWAEAEDPTEGLRRHVTAWVFTRMSDPFADARGVAGFDD
jgi:hypothetical protein